MLDIKGSVAVITGGASGIGRSLAEYWLAQGGKVVIGDVVESALTQAAAELQGEVATVLCNVTQEEDCARLADTAIERFGQINLVALLPASSRMASWWPRIGRRARSPKKCFWRISGPSSTST